MEIILLLERTYGLIGYNDPTVSEIKISNPHLRKAVVYIETNYSGDLSLESIVRSASLNHSTLTQIFKSELNMTPIEYLWHHRLTVAKKFLEFTNLPIKEIAAMVGYADSHFFSRVFRSRLGVSPKAYRDVGNEGGR